MSTREGSSDTQVTDEARERARLRWLAAAGHMYQAREAAREGLPPVEFEIRVNAPDGPADLQDPYNEVPITFGIQRDCDPAMITMYAQRAETRELVAGLILNENQALELATGLLVAFVAKPAPDLDEDESS